MNPYDIDAHMRDLTPHQIKLVEALYNAGDTWLTRAQIARAVGKRRLTPYDINILAMLAHRGLIEMATRPTSAPGSDFAYIYRMPDPTAYAIQQWTQLRAQIQQEQQLQKRRPPIDLLGGRS